MGDFLQYDGRVYDRWRLLLGETGGCEDGLTAVTLTWFRVAMF
jgi:hypothetical protein